MPQVENWQLGREMEYPYEEARPDDQWAGVFDLNKCIECQTCTLACKTTWTHEEGQEHMFWNNVETKPYGSHPIGWDQRLVEELGEMEWDDDTYEGETIFEAKGQEWIGDGTDIKDEGGTAGDMAGFMPGTDDWRYPNLGEDEPAGEEMTPNTHFDETTHPVWFFYLPRICNHCTFAACAGSCPAQAIYKREEDGVVLIDEQECVAWQQCNEACPYKKAIYNMQESISQKCIGCYPKTEDGKAPQCFESCIGKIRLHGYINTPDEADVGDPTEERVNPVDYLVHDKEIALPLYPQFGLEPNVYYIPPTTAPIDYLTQMFGPGAEAAVEMYQSARNGGEPAVQALLQLMGSTEWSLTGFEVDGDEAVGYYDGDEVGRVPITEPTADRDRYDEQEDVYRLDVT